MDESDLQLQMQHRRRSKTPVFFVGQLERKSVVYTTTTTALDKAQILAHEYQAVLPLRLEPSFIQNINIDRDHDIDLAKSYHLPRTPKRLRKIKCQLSLRDLVKQHEQCAPSPSTPGSDAETLVGSPPCSPLDTEFEKSSIRIQQPLFALAPSYSDNDTESEASLPAMSPSPDTDIGLKICTELLTNELATALLRQHATDTKDRASGLQILRMIEAYETVQSQVRRMLYDATVTGKQFGHVRDAERFLEHWLKALYAVYDREQEEEGKKNRLDYEWPLMGETEAGRVVRGDG